MAAADVPNFGDSAGLTSPVEAQAEHTSSAQKNGGIVAEDIDLDHKHVESADLPHVNGLNPETGPSGGGEISSLDALGGDSAAASGEIEVVGEEANVKGAEEGVEGVLVESSVLAENGILGSVPVVPPPAENVAPFVQNSSASVISAPSFPQQRDFYVAMVPRPDLSDLISRIKAADLKAKEKVEKVQFLNAALRIKQASRNEANANFREARDRAISCSKEVRRKYDEAKPLQEALRKLQEVGSAARYRSRELACSSEEELNQRIASIEYKMEHESLTLTEEKQLMREMKQLEASRGSVRENEVLLVSVSDSQGQRDALQARLQPLLAEVDVLKLERDAAQKICDSVEEEKKAIEDAVNELRGEQEAAWQEKEVAYAQLWALRAEANKKEEDYKEYCRDLDKVEGLVMQKDMAALEDFCTQQVEKIHSKLVGSAQYRASYFKANERSTIRRFKSLDTRRLGLDEDPAKALGLASSSYSTTSVSSASAPEPEAKASKLTSGAKAGEEKAGSGSKKGGEGGNTVLESGAKKAGKGAKPAEKKDEGGVKTKEVVSLSNGKVDASETAEFVLRVEKVSKEEDASAKEKRREDALQKAKEAEERKKKAAERQQARAQARAAKDAEEAAKRREKEREKRIRRRAAALAAATGEKVGESGTEGTETEENVGVSSGEGGEEGYTGVGESKKKGADSAAQSGLELTKRQRKRLAAAAPKGGESEAKKETARLKGISKKKGAKGTSIWVVALAVAFVLALLGALGYLLYSQRVVASS